MFKFVVACALMAVAAASPGAIISTPLVYSTGIAPAVATYSAAGGFYNPAPVVYSSPLASVPYSGNYVHLIKKRSPSPQFLVPSAAAYTGYASYSSPLATTYAAAPVAYRSPLATTYAAPIVHSAPIFTAAHLIKKRSAPLLSAPVIPTYSTAPILSAYSAAPLVSTYSAAPVVSTYSALPGANIIASSYFHNAPLAYTQFIKK